jgi:arylsulfatase A-like enzyme
MPTRRGFDRFYGWLDSTHDYWKANTGRSHTHGPCGYAPLWDQETPVDSMDAYLTRELTEKALNFIDRHKDEPFFLYIAHHCSHVPLQVPGETHEKYSPLGSGENTITTRAMYEELDNSIGAVLDRLEQYGLRNNTIIIYQSDNGGGEPEAQLNWIYRGGKFTLLEGGIRVPTLISWPAGLPVNKTYGHPVINIDFLPTLLAAAGIETEKNFDGINLMPYLKGERKDVPHQELYWTTGRGFAIRDGDWKLVFTSNGQGLYNLKDDPRELVDMRNELPDKAMQLKEKYDAWNKKNTVVKPSEAEREYVNSVRSHADESLKNWSYSPKFGHPQP